MTTNKYQLPYLAETLKRRIEAATETAIVNIEMGEDEAPICRIMFDLLGAEGYPIFAKAVRERTRRNYDRLADQDA